MEKNYFIRKSNIDGFGCFALKNIRKGRVMGHMKGKKVTIKELRGMYKKKKERIDDPFQISDKEYLILAKPEIYINHSCNPNAGIKKIGTIFALKDIKNGSEITFDYSTTEWTNDRAWGINWTKLWKIKCNCGSKTCRKYIRVFPKLPKKIREKYLKKDALPNFILKKLLQ